MIKALKSYMRLTHGSEHLVAASIEPGLALKEKIRALVLFILDCSILSPCHRTDFA